MFHALVLGTLILLPNSSCKAERIQAFMHAATEHWTGWSVVLLRDLSTADQAALVQIPSEHFPRLDAPRHLL
jgi:hypothetical protein